MATHLEDGYMKDDDDEPRPYLEVGEDVFPAAACGLYDYLL